jgi:hypothetical protein
MIRWFFRCIPGLSGIALIALLSLALIDDGQPQFISSRQHTRSSVKLGLSSQGLKLSQMFFIFYSLLVHIDTAFVAIRLCFSIRVVKNKMRSTLLRRKDLPSGFYSEGILQPADVKELNSRSSPFEPDRTRPNEKVLGEVIHAIIIPNYKEDIDTLRLTLAVLASHPRAKTQYEVCVLRISSEHDLLMITLNL